MQIGLNCSSFGNVGYPKYWGEGSYKKMKEFGYSCVDFSILGDTNSKLYASDKAVWEAILLHEKALAEEAGLVIHQAHAPCLSLARPLKQEEISELIENIKKAIESCKILGCKYLVVHPFMPNGWSDRGSPVAEDTFSKNVTYLQHLCDFAKEYGITLCYENMPCIGFSISTPEEILKVIKAVDRDNLKMCFDTGHVSAFSRQLNLGQEIRRCGEYIKVLHVHDNQGGSDQHNFPGMGMADWKDSVAALNEIGFNGVFSLELIFPDKFSEPVFEATCRLAVQMATDIVNGLE